MSFNNKSDVRNHLSARRGTLLPPKTRTQSIAIPEGPARADGTMVSSVPKAADAPIVKRN
jgi:hypothetical protein